MTHLNKQVPVKNLTEEINLDLNLILWYLLFKEISNAR